MSPELKTKHERLGDRISNILIRLYEGHVLQLDQLAEEFKTCSKTIKRDFDRLSYLPIELDSKNKKYSLSKEYTRSFGFNPCDFANFAEQSGVSALYPNFE